MNWSHIHTLNHQGTVLEVSGSQEAGNWLAAPAGLFHNLTDTERWYPVQKEIPFWHVNTVAACGGTILAGGLPKGIVRSGNGGRSWEMAWVEQTQLPITVIRPSPNADSDRVWIAGTRGDGILRSTDDGRHWALSNWGLRDFTIVDLAVAPVWGDREFLFAVALDGVYQSPNGGRAWRYVWDAWEDETPLTCAVSADFETDRTVWVGTESGALFESRDRGRTFERYSAAFDMVNSLHSVGSDGLLIGAGSGGIARLENGTSDSRSVATPLQPDLDPNRQQIFRISHTGGRLFAALLNGGIWSSEDAGGLWQEVAGLNAGRFVWLKAGHNRLLAGGPETGLWQIESGLAEPLPTGNGPILAADLIDNKPIYCQPGMLTIDLDVVHTSSKPHFVRLTALKDTFWAVDPNEVLWRGDRDQLEKIPFPANVSIAALDGDLFSEEARVAVAAYNRSQKEIATIVWIPSEARWQPIGKMISRDGRARLAWDRYGDLWLSVGKRIRRFQLNDGEHSSYEIGHDSTPIIGLAAGAQDSEIVLAAANVEQVALFEASTQAWKIIPFLPQEPIADIALLNDTLYVMTVDGRIWQLDEKS